MVSYVCVSASCTCASVEREEERVGREGRRRQIRGGAPGGPSPLAPRRQQSFRDTEGTSPHTTLPGAWWTEPHQGTPLPGPGQGSCVRPSTRITLSLSLYLSLSSHHKHWWLLTSWEASFLPCRRENVAVWARLPPPVVSHQNVDALHFQTRSLALHSFCLLERSFYAQFRAV